MILRVRDKDGNVTDIYAIRGKDGRTPEKGVDYFTEEELAAMCTEVFAMLPAFEMVATHDDGSSVTYQIYGKVVTE